MKTRKLTSAVTLLAVAALGFVACKKEGPEGPAGKDGNANVQVIMIDSGLTWNASGVIDIPVAEITTEVLQNYATLGYAFRGIYEFQIPGPYWAADHLIRTYSRIGFYTLEAEDWTGATPASPYSVDSVKIILIEGTKNASVEENTIQMFDELEEAGVDAGNYNEVIQYLGETKRM